MNLAIRKVAVLGAGVMGSGIAAHVANAGIPVVLLDMVPPRVGTGEDPAAPAFRNKFAAGALARLARQKPAPLFADALIGMIETGNFEDDMAKIAGCDWIVEAVTEDLAIKQKLFAAVEQHAKPDAIISSNTSGLSVQGMTEGRGDSFKKHFLVTHFFNPVRYMRLLELVAGVETAPAVLAAMRRFGEETLGKGIVFGKDTTNFIANRIGTYGMMKVMQEMAAAGFGVEEVDAVFGPALGRPKSAVFRTADVVGLDTFAHVARNCHDTLVDDEEREVFRLPGFVATMLERGLLGDKAGKGFYKKSEDSRGERVILSLNLETMEYGEQKSARFESLGAARKATTTGARIAAVLGGTDAAAKIAEKVTLHTLAYASRRIPEIADDVVNVDRALCWGFGWELGPFQTWDAIGVQRGLDRMAALGIAPAPWVRDMVAAGRTSFYAEDGQATTFWSRDTAVPAAVPVSRRALSLHGLKQGTSRLAGNMSASLWDMGDGVALLEFHTKMNAIDTDIISMLHQAVDTAERDCRGLVIGNEAEAFSAGANIFFLLGAAKQGQYDVIARMIDGFQAANQRLRYSLVPVVTAPHGLTLGGGAEVTMGGNAVQAGAELYMGLVEAGVGLIPGGAGNLQLLRNVYGPFAADRAFDAMPFIQKVFMAVGMGKVSTSAEEARAMGFLSASDGISLNPDFVLGDAKARVIGMAESGFRPPRPTAFFLPGPSGKATIDMMLYDMELNRQISGHDRLIGAKLATVLTGGDTSSSLPVSEEKLLEIEKECFLSLCGEEKTHARIAHMLQTGKPLRN
ncbi:MAG: enoyl-CoA hydratase/isomerase family protein [Candidatus Schekmanbacteria bacterium]|nr:enoyl-CoA hydratase/isomerase family protein [Candidatus Schekmanbacteria bacterium]